MTNSFSDICTTVTVQLGLSCPVFVCKLRYDGPFITGEATMAGGNVSAVTFTLRKTELEANDEYRSWLVMSLCRNPQTGRDRQANRQTDRKTSRQKYTD